MGEEAIGSTLVQLCRGGLLPAVDGDLGEGTLIHHLAEFVPTHILILAEATIPEEEPSEDSEDDRVDPEFVEAEGTP